MSDQYEAGISKTQITEPDFEDKLEPIVIHPLDPMAGKQKIEFESKDLYRSFFSVLDDPVRLDILKSLAFEDKSFNDLREDLNIPQVTLLSHIKELTQKHYIYHRPTEEFALTDGGRIITRLINKVAKYLDPQVYNEDNTEIIFPFRYHFRSI